MDRNMKTRLKESSGWTGRVCGLRPANSTSAPVRQLDVDSEGELGWRRALEKVRRRKSRSHNGTGINTSGMRNTGLHEKWKSTYISNMSTDTRGKKGVSRKPADRRGPILHFSQRHEYFKGHSRREEAGCVDWIGSPRTQEAECEMNLSTVACPPTLPVILINRHGKDHNTDFLFTLSRVFCLSCFSE